MKKVMLAVSAAVVMVAMTGCNDKGAQQRKSMDEPFRQEREFMNQAIRHRSPDVMRVDVIDSTVVYTHIYPDFVTHFTKVPYSALKVICVTRFG